MRTGNQEADRLAAIGRQARRFQSHVRRILAGRGALAGGVAGVWAAGLILLAARLAGIHGSTAERLHFTLALAALVAIIAAVRATRRTPSPDAILAALDAASAAGGLVMCSGADGAPAWPVAVTRLPDIVWNGSRAVRGLALALCFCLTTILLPMRFFGGSSPSIKQGLESLAGQLAERVEQAESESLLPEPLIAALSNQLARIAESGDAADPARTLEALDHIEEELSKSAAEQAEALTAEQAALQGTLALAEQMASRFDAAPPTGTQAAAAAEALSQLLDQAPLAPSLASNLLATVAGTNGLSSATLQQLAARLREAGACSEAQLRRLGELRLADASACRGSGSCTNAQTCAAALAQLLDSNGPDAEAAACLAALCNTPGSGGISRGRGDAPLTWTDPSSREGAAFKDEALNPAHLPAADQARLEGLSAAAPEVADTPAPATSGALLDTAAPTRGGAPQAPILPRHRETVTRFFK